MPKPAAAAYRLYRVLLFFVIAIVVPLNILGWYAWNSVRNNLVDQLTARLQVLTAATADGIQIWWPSEEEDITTLVRNQLDRLVYSGNIDRVFILEAPDQVALLSALDTPLPEVESVLAADRDLIAKAFAGDYAVSPARVLTTGDTIRAYAPLWSGLETSGVIGIETRPGYVDVLRHLRRALLLFGLISLVFGLLLIGFGSRLVHQVLRMEKSLERTQRALVMGQMTASVAHEIRNPVGIIAANAQVLQRSGDETVREIGTDIQAETRRLDAIVRRFLSLSEGGQQRKEVAAREILDYALDAVRNRFREAPLEWKMDLEVENIRLCCDPDLIAIVFVNILQNAAEALHGKPGGGTVMVTARRDGDALLVRVADTGPGMSREVLENATVPFFTGKAGGTGLGLAMADRIVHDHGGTLELKSRPGAGTRVTVRLPLRAADEGEIE